MANNINWKKGDYIRLGRAVSDFNKKINELQQEENKLYLPTPVDYKKAKQEISTRQELNRIIKSLRRFQKEDAGELYITEAGEQLTKWERRELGIQARTITRRLNKELTSIKESSPSGLMGELEQRRIKSSINRLKKIENLKGYEFNRLKKAIKIQGVSDYSFKRATNYRVKFLEELENLSKSNTKFKKVYDYLYSIKNPQKFYNITQKSSILQDFFQWYQSPDTYLATMDGDEIADYVINEFK